VYENSLVSGGARKVGTLSPISEMLKFALGVGFLPATILTGWLILEPQRHMLVSYFGEPEMVLEEPGIYFQPIWGRSVHSISTKRYTTELKQNVVSDFNGNPIVVSGVITYEVKKSVKAILNVEDPHGFCTTQALAVRRMLVVFFGFFLTIFLGDEASLFSISL